MKLIPEIEKESQRIRQCVGAANYIGALKLARALYQKYPNEIFVKYRYANLLADTALYTTLPNRKKMHQEAMKLFAKMMRSLKGVPQPLRGNIRNEYYYFSDQYLKQYRLGRERVRQGERLGVFSEGVGASFHAYELLKKGQRMAALKWAKKSVQAWQKYMKIRKDYYYPWTNLGFAWGILGDHQEMEKCLKEAQRLTGRPRSYREFQEIRKKIKLIKR